NACTIICCVSGMLSSPVSPRMRTVDGGRWRQHMQVDRASGIVREWPRCLFSLLSLSLGFTHAWHPSPSLAEGRDHGFDREKQSSAVFRIFDELGALHIEAFRCLVLCMDQHRPDADAP